MGTKERTTTAASSEGAPSECQNVSDFGNVDNAQAHHTNNASWLILILGYLGDKAIATRQSSFQENYTKPSVLHNSS